MASDIPARATSFGGIAEDYHRYRPAPPLEAADWLLPTNAGLVADLCAGTGGFSRVLAARAVRVVAIELDLRMLRVLGQRPDGILSVCGNGEILAVRGSSLGAVVASSGWHWLDAGAAVKEAGRVLRPGGVLGVVWSGPRRDLDWVAEMLGQARRPEGRPRRQLDIPPDAPFARPEHSVIDWSIRRTPEELVGLAGTYSRVITSTPAERLGVARRAERVVCDHPGLQSEGRVQLPMRTVCWRAVRLGS